MVEHNVEEMVGVCCDGYGYGPDGEAWGGEILLCSKKASGFKRLAHLEKQPLIGGDLATRYPLRVAAGVLNGEAHIEDWLFQRKKHFPHGEKEIEIIFQQLRNRKGTIETTSCGRVLDAISALLGICYERTYEGEPSMKLEAVALQGKDALNLKPIIEGDTLNTTQIVEEIFENIGKHSRRDLAYSAQAYMAKGLAALAMKQADENGARTIGFSGGVACNEMLTRVMRKQVEDAHLIFLVHEDIPPGDGGLSFGQAAASGFFQP
jgi:hydrogenase maturation protein HypF